jgi:hypothetical protein
MSFFPGQGRPPPQPPPPSSSSMAGGGRRRSTFLNSSAAQQQQRMALVGLCAATLVALLGVALRFVPVFTTCMMGLLASVLFFIMTERWQTHNAIEFQNRFWTFLGFVFGFFCVFIRDSPFRFPETHNGAAWFVVFLVAFVAHMVDRHLRRLDLKKIPRLPRVNSADIGQELKASARKKIDDIQTHMKVIDNPYLSSTFQNIVAILPVLHAEQSLISIFEEASKVSALPWHQKQ